LIKQQKYFFMKKTLIQTSLLLTLSILISFFFIKKTHLKENSDKKLSKDKLIPNDWFYQQRSYPNGINKAVQKEAVKQVKAMKKAASLKRRVNDWEFAGPTNIGGRITDIEMPKDDVNTIYAAAASGGIFKSIDLGNSWQAIFDEAVSLSIGDMALAPSDNSIIYVGTGEANAGGGSLAYDGYGVYKSGDAGNKWQHIGLEDAGSIGRIAVDPQNSDRVFIAAMGDLFGNDADRGVYRTEDSGANWEQVLFVSDSTGAIDLVIHPDNPDFILAAMWERIRRPNYRKYEGHSSGIYKSTDGGDTWTKLTTSLPNGLLGRIGLAIAPSNPNKVYTVIADQYGLEGIYSSDNFGNSWSTVNQTDINTVSYMWWFGKIFVDPNDENTLFTTSLEMYKSTTGGNSWTNINRFMHVDQHALVIHPLNSKLLVAGNDGGVYVSKNGGLSWDFKNTLPITQFYTCEIDYLQPKSLYGGSQDNGISRTITGNLNDWEFLSGGDGFGIQVDPTQNNIIYIENQYGNLGCSYDSGYSFNLITPSISITNWNTPYIIHPGNTETLLYGANTVYRTDDRGNSWSTISPDLANGPYEGNIPFGTITSIDVSTVNYNIIYAGTDDGNVWISKNDGANWDKISGTLPNRWVTKVLADPYNESSAYVTFSGYRYLEKISHIFKTNDFGVTWLDLSNDLPEVPVNDLVVNLVNEGHLYVSTDFGVFTSYNDGANWEILGESLPNVPVTDIDYNIEEGFLLAATYGRSMYKIDIEEVLSEKKTPLVGSFSCEE